MQILGVYVRYETVMLALIVVFILSLIAQGKVKRVFKRYNTVPAARNVPAYQAAQEMLLDNGSAVTVHPVQGTLTDHYDPRNDTVGLSTEVYNSSSVAALAIAAHEIGHVLQYQENYAPIRWRTAVLPVANIGATFGPYMILIGLFMNMYPLAVIGLALYGAMFLFQLVTLPVEFNASQRGLELLDRGGYIDYANRTDAKKVLSAAAWTYVLAALGSLLSFLRFFMLVNGNRRRN